MNFLKNPWVIAVLATVAVLWVMSQPFADKLKSTVGIK